MQEMREEFVTRAGLNMRSDGESIPHVISHAAFDSALPSLFQLGWLCQLANPVGRHLPKLAGSPLVQSLQHEHALV